MGNMMPSLKIRLLVSLLIVLAVFAVYGQTRHHAFLDFDDAEYITENEHVRTGLSGRNAAWALTAVHSNNWHPLTWISHMTDVEMFGLQSGRHHLVNVVLHAANSFLILWLLSRLTGAFWPSAAVAAFFALHPLHVESVAWAAERKDVLSTLFLLLTLGSWVGYVHAPNRLRYVRTLGLFVLGLMAKQMLVTLPALLLLLDIWPLRRGALPPQQKWLSTWRPLVMEKIPFFALALAASAIVILAQRASGVVKDMAPFPLAVRLENAAVSYGAYLGKLIWPANLSVFYPHPGDTLSVAAIAGAVSLLAALSLLAWRFRSRGWPLVGWLWYLGTLLPVIGLIQVGIQGMADRYTYIPSLGIFILLAWGTAELTQGLSFRRPALAATAAVALATMGWLAWQQTATWKNNESLYQQAIRAVPDNYWAYNNLGAAVAGRGNLEDGVALFRKALAIRPDYPGANRNMAVAAYKQGRYNEALVFIDKTLAVQGRHAGNHVLAGYILEKLGRGKEAETHYREALRIAPNSQDAQEALAKRRSWSDSLRTPSGSAMSRPS